MRRRASVIAVCLVCVPRVLAAADQFQKPVKVTVVDVATKKPLTEFSYYLSVIVPGEFDQLHQPAMPARVDVKSPTGTFSLNAPGSCKIELGIDSPDVVAGYLHNETSIFHVLSTDTKRSFCRPSRGRHNGPWRCPRSEDGTTDSRRDGRADH